MTLYKDPKEHRDYYRVEVPTTKPAYLVLDRDGTRLPLKNLSAGGFAAYSRSGWHNLLRMVRRGQQGRRFRGTMFLELEDAGAPVAVSLVFEVVAANRQVRCRIAHIEPEDRDLLFTYVFEVDQMHRSLRTEVCH